MVKLARKKKPDVSDHKGRKGKPAGSPGRGGPGSPALQGQRQTGSGTPRKRGVPAAESVPPAGPGSPLPTLRAGAGNGRGEPGRAGRGAPKRVWRLESLRFSVGSARAVGEERWRSGKRGRAALT